MSEVDDLVPRSQTPVTVHVERPTAIAEDADLVDPVPVPVPRDRNVDMPTVLEHMVDRVGPKRTRRPAS